MTSLSFCLSKTHSTKSNVRLLDLNTAQHNYIRAQGMFMLATPLTETTQFKLSFTGQGIVKLHALPTKEDAIKFLQSKKPLPKGSTRLQTSGFFTWEVSLDSNQCRILLVNKDFSTKEVRGGPMLILDIEYGDVCVRLRAINSNVHEICFDSVNHSNHILVKDRGSTAELKHFNPLGICRLDSPLKKGNKLGLTVIGNKGHSGVGPYIRLHITWGKEGHQNLRTFLRLQGNSVFSSEIFLVKAGQERQVELTCCDGEIPCFKRLQTVNSGVIKVQLTWPWCEDCLLWFELNKVVIKAKLLDPSPQEGFCTAGAAHQTTPKTMQESGYEIPSPLWCATVTPRCTFGTDNCSSSHTLTEISLPDQTERKTVATQTLSLLDTWQPPSLNNMAKPIYRSNYFEEETSLKRAVLVSTPKDITKNSHVEGIPERLSPVKHLGELFEHEPNRSSAYSLFTPLSSVGQPTVTSPGQHVKVRGPACHESPWVASNPQGDTVAAGTVRVENLQKSPELLSSGSFFLSTGRLQCLSPCQATGKGEITAAHAIHELKFQPTPLEGATGVELHTGSKERSRCGNSRRH